MSFSCSSSIHSRSSSSSFSHSLSVSRSSSPTPLSFSNSPVDSPSCSPSTRYRPCGFFFPLTVEDSPLPSTCEAPKTATVPILDQFLYDEVDADADADADAVSTCTVSPSPVCPPVSEPLDEMTDSFLFPFITRSPCPSKINSTKVITEPKAFIRCPSPKYKPSGPVQWTDWGDAATIEMLLDQENENQIARVG